MAWFFDLFTTGSVGGSVLVLALISALGLILGSFRIRGIAPGIVMVLFSGLLFGHFGAVVAPTMLEFIRDFGLILFVYAVGVQVGPDFIAPLRRYGAALNVLAVCIVALGWALAAAIGHIASIEAPVAVGMLSGATTNTPSLGAAQAALRDLPTYTEQMGQLPGLGYAVSYPFGNIGVILMMVVIRPLFARRTAEVGGVTQAAPLADLPHAEGRPTPANGDLRQVLAMFLGIALGVVVGSIPLPVRGLPAPLRLGLAGGPLVVAIALSARARIGPLTWRMSPEASTLLRDVGIALFLSCVGLIAGRRLVETLTVGDGVRWMAWATLITLTPMILAAVAARGLLKTDYASTCGLMAGSMTDPAALAFSWSVTKSDATLMAYATVYPLTMVLRVLSTQVFVLLLTR